MKLHLLAVCILWSASLLGCRTHSVALADNSTPTQQLLEYNTLSMVTLAFGKDVRVRATIEELEESITAIRGQKPRLKLVIKNLSTDRIIYEQECGDSSLSAPGFWIERGLALVMTIKGGSGDGIKVYEVTESDARIVLDETYRAAAILMPNDELGGDMGFLIVDAEHATDPLEVRRYKYSRAKRQFVMTGKVNFSQFMRLTKAQFNSNVK